MSSDVCTAGADEGNTTPEQFGKLIGAEIVKWAAIIRETAIQPD